MDVKFINPFLVAFSKTLEQLNITDVKRGNINKKSKLHIDSAVSTVILLNGGLRGNIVLAMSEDTAKSLASTMMMGMPISALDEMTKSAIGELSSMIVGSATTLLSALDISLQISPPIILLEPADVNPLETLAIDFETPVGKIELNIGFTV
jgi:chemotaxis protein CheX